jgi:hypothetical protein
MLFVSEYQLKPHLAKSEVKRLMDVFGERGAADGEISNYIRADGSGGLNILENSDASSLYADALLYGEWLSFKVTPILKIEDAVGPIFAYLEK